MENPSDLAPASNSGDRLNTWVAIAVALLASFMSVTKVKDDNIVQAMLQVKSDAVDTWSEYQAKRIKQHLAELGRDQAVALRTAVSPRAALKWDEQINRYEFEISRYRREEEDLKSKAIAFEKKIRCAQFSGRPV